MQFRDDSNQENGIINQIEVDTFGVGKITGNTSLLAKTTFLINKWNGKCNNWMQEYSVEWPHDDINHGDFPIETFDFEDDIDNYGFARDIKLVKRIEAHDANYDADKGWYDLDFKKESEKGDDRFGNDSGKPSAVWFNGRSFITDCPIDTDLADQYRLTYDREAHLFVVGDTSAEPGLPTFLQPILIVGPKIDLLSGINKDGSKDRQISALKEELGYNPQNPFGLFLDLINYCERKNAMYKQSVGRKYNNYD